MSGFLQVIALLLIGLLVIVGCIVSKRRKQYLLVVGSIWLIGLISALINDPRLFCDITCL